MIVTELQNIIVYEVNSDKDDDSMIAIVEEGEIRFYKEIEMKYSYAEKYKKKVK